MSIVAVVLAGGRGERMGRGENKVFVPLRGIPAIVRAIAPFSTLCSHLVVVARQEELAAMEQLLKRYGMSHLVHMVVPGGSNRQASVLAGLMALPPDADGCWSMMPPGPCDGGVINGHQFCMEHAAESPPFR